MKNASAWSQPNATTANGFANNEARKRKEPHDPPTMEPARSDPVSADAGLAGCCGGAMSAIHVLPVGDLKEHTESDDCECKPRVEYVGEGGKVVVHNSYDGREYSEHKTDVKQ